MTMHETPRFKTVFPDGRTFDDVAPCWSLPEKFTEIKHESTNIKSCEIKEASACEEYQIRKENSSLMIK